MIEWHALKVTTNDWHHTEKEGKKNAGGVEKKGRS